MGIQWLFTLSARQCHCVHKCNTIGLSSFCIAAMSVPKVKLGKWADVIIVELGMQRVNLMTVVLRISWLGSRKLCVTANWNHIQRINWKRKVLFDHIWCCEDEVQDYGGWTKIRINEIILKTMKLSKPQFCRSKYWRLQMKLNVLFCNFFLLQDFEVQICEFKSHNSSNHTMTW